MHVKYPVSVTSDFGPTWHEQLRSGASSFPCHKEFLLIQLRMYSHVENPWTSFPHRTNRGRPPYPPEQPGTRAQARKAVGISLSFLCETIVVCLASHSGPSSVISASAKNIRDGERNHDGGRPARSRSVLFTGTAHVEKHGSRVKTATEASAVHEKQE